LESCGHVEKINTVDCSGRPIFNDMETEERISHIWDEGEEMMRAITLYFNSPL